MQDHLQVTFGPSYRVNGLTASSSSLLNDVALAATTRQYQDNSTGNAHQSVQTTSLPGPSPAYPADWPKIEPPRPSASWLGYLKHLGLRPQRRPPVCHHGRRAVHAPIPRQHHHQLERQRRPARHQPPNFFADPADVKVAAHGVVP
ncbi:hypothetical protein ARSEF1564_008930 [Beauveria bassiana]